MAWEERPKSRKLQEGPKTATRTDVWVGRSFTDSSVALADLKATAPAAVIVGNKLCTGPVYNVEPEVNPTNSNISVYYGSVTYKTADAQSQNEAEPETPTDTTLFTFSFSSMEDTILEAYEQTTYTKTGPQTNFTKAINQHHHDLPPEGTVKQIPIANFVGKSVIPDALATAEWWKGQLDLIWTLNETEFRKLPPKCVALTGISGELRSSGYWHIEYSFEYRPVRAAQTISAGGGTTISVPALPGWTYFWAEYTKTTSDSDNDPDTPKEVRRTVRRVHAADIYETTNFNTELVITGA